MSVESLYAASCQISFYIGLPLNLLLLLLITKRTPKEVRAYSRILKLICYADIIFTTNYYFYQPVRFHSAQLKSPAVRRM